MARSHHTRLLDLVQTVSDVATSDDETLATVAYLINSGKVRLCGGFAGGTIDLSARAGANFDFWANF
jgi:hypothetical protein